MSATTLTRPAAVAAPTAAGYAVRMLRTGTPHTACIVELTGPDLAPTVLSSDQVGMALHLSPAQLRAGLSVQDIASRVASGVRRGGPAFVRDLAERSRLMETTSAHVGADPFDKPAYRRLWDTPARAGLVTMLAGVLCTAADGFPAVTS